MQKLTVHYCGWGEDWPLGTLADDGRMLLFEYSAAALEQGLDLSPLHLKLASRSYGDFPGFMQRLPGLIADSLPDGWGLLLMDRLFRQQGRGQPGPLERLAYVGDRGMGALRFEPADKPGTKQPDWNLATLARASTRVLAGESRATLEALALARDCGLDVPASAHFDLGGDLAAFGAARFDREQGQRVPIHSLAGLLHVDFRVPGAADYTAFLRATRMLTRDARQVEAAYARAVFNVAFHNRDDHPKNFAWRLGRDRRWRLAPAFDLTFSEGPMGQHHMDVCGAGDAIERKHLLQLAREADVPTQAAQRVIARVLDQARRFPERLETDALTETTRDKLQQAVERCRKRLERA